MNSGDFKSRLGIVEILGLRIGSFSFEVKGDLLDFGIFDDFHFSVALKARALGDSTLEEPRFFGMLERFPQEKIHQSTIL